MTFTVKARYFALGSLSVASLWAIQHLVDRQTSASSVPKTVESISHDHPILRYGHHGPQQDFLKRQAYVVSYNRALRNPHWVAEHLTKEDFMQEPGEDEPDRHHASFKEDRELPAAFQSKLKDYRGTVYDRGHMVPAADVKSSQQAVNETFLLSNISPQIGKGFNRGYWAYFEAFVRQLTQSFDHVYVVTGPLFLPQQQQDGKYHVHYEVIGDPPNTAVPTHFFKVVLVEKKGKQAMAGFVIPNTPIGESKLEEFEMPIEAIEKSAGLEFFPQLERKAVDRLCAQVPCLVHRFRGFSKATLKEK